MKITCKCCGKDPNEIKEYLDLSKRTGVSPRNYVMQQEGTYNILSGKFYCTQCYIKIGMPLGVA